MTRPSAISQTGSASSATSTPRRHRAAALSCRLSYHDAEEDLDLHSAATAGIIYEIWLQHGPLRVDGITEAMSDAEPFLR
jgi:hypothetical protein